MTCGEMAKYIAATVEMGRAYLKSLSTDDRRPFALAAMRALVVSWRGLYEWKGPVTEKNADRARRLYEIAYERAVEARRLMEIGQ